MNVGELPPAKFCITIMIPLKSINDRDVKNGYQEKENIILKDKFYLYTKIKSLLYNPEVSLFDIYFLLCVNQDDIYNRPGSLQIGSLTG